MTFRAAWWLSAAVPLAAHMVSMSTGDVRIEGRRLRFELRMPLYEVAHVKDPARSLLAAVRFSSGGAAARELESRCQEIPAQGAYLCQASYEFPAAVDRLQVTSSLHSITVANHVHLLRAGRNGAADQAVMDISFPRADLRFRPPTPGEIAAQQIAAGAMRAAGGAAPLLFLAALALAARTRRELAALAGAFLAGEALACLLVPRTGWMPAPRFVEAAAALTIAYLAVEILLLPQAGHRWAVVGILGVFHGLYFAMFIASSRARAHWVLAGVAAGEIVLIAVFAGLLGRLRRALAPHRPERAGSAALLAIGLVWFLVRLRG